MPIYTLNRFVTRLFIKLPLQTVLFVPFLMQIFAVVKVWSRLRYRSGFNFSLLFGAGLCLSLILGSCTSTNLVDTAALLTENQQATTPKVVRIGHQPHGAPPLLKAKGALEKRFASLGISVKWIEFPAGLPIMTRDFARKHYDIVKIVIEEMRQVGIWANEHPSELAKMIAANMGLKLSTALKISERAIFNAQPMQDQAVEEQQRIANIFFRLGLLPKQIWVEDAVWKVGLRN